MGQTTISWNASNATVVEIRIGSANGQLFAMQGPKGSMMTGTWVQEGTTVYLVDVSVLFWIACLSGTNWKWRLAA